MTSNDSVAFYFFCLDSSFCENKLAFCVLGNRNLKSVPLCTFIYSVDKVQSIREITVSDIFAINPHVYACSPTLAVHTFLHSLSLCTNIGPMLSEGLVHEMTL